MLWRLAKASGSRAASVPPAMTTSASPYRIRRNASTMAMVPAAQAATEVIMGPRMPNWIDGWDEENGEWTGASRG